MASINLSTLPTIYAHRAEIAKYMQDAVALHSSAIMREIAVFDAERQRNPIGWYRLCVLKSILSPGAKLDTNIALAKLMRDALTQDSTLSTYEDVEVYRSACRYGGRSVGRNIVHALGAWAIMERQHHIMPEHTPGYSVKTCAWAEALYDARSHVYTLDVHMLRKIGELSGLDTHTITNAAYAPLATFMMSVHNDVCPSLPYLASQWACWNEARHAGVHASHIALAR